MSLDKPVCPYCCRDVQKVSRLTITSMDDTIITYCPHSDCRKIFSVQVQPISDDIPTINQVVADAFRE